MVLNLNQKHVLTSRRILTVKKTFSSDGTVMKLTNLARLLSVFSKSTERVFANYVLR